MIKLRTYQASLKTILRIRGSGTDFRRWGTDSAALSQDWDSRTAQIAALVHPGASVIEFGAGRMILKSLLPKGCRYTPSDIVERGCRTIVCDLNAAKLPEFPAHDIAVFSGVLEYIIDVPSLIYDISNIVNSIVASYAVYDHKGTIIERRARGWVNDYSCQEFQEIFLKCGFCCSYREMWRSQVIYKFVQRQQRINIAK